MWNEEKESEIFICNSEKKRVLVCLKYCLPLFTKHFTKKEKWISDVDQEVIVAKHEDLGSIASIPW